MRYLDKIKYGNVKCIDEPLYCYYLDDTNSITRSEQGQFDEDGKLMILKPLDKIEEQINLNSIQKKSIKAVRYKWSVHKYFRFSNCLESRQRELILKDIRRYRIYYYLNPYDSLWQKIRFELKYILYRMNMKNIASATSEIIHVLRFQRESNENRHRNSV